MKKVLLPLVSLLVVVIVLTVVSFPLQWWNISLEDLRAKYRRPESRFIIIEGAELHYQDEGNPDGMAVVLFHGHLGSLRAFDEWVPVLGDRYRLIRFDMPATGLSGPDASGDYSIDRRILLKNRLLEHLRVDRHFIVGTSFNGPTAFRSAAREPDRVMGLVLGNAAGLPRAPGAGPNRPEPNPVLRWVYQYYRPRSFFERAVPGLIPDPTRWGPETVEQFYLMANAKGRGEEGTKVLRQFDSQDAPDYLKRIRCPVLLQWATEGRGPLLVDKDLSRFQEWLASASVETIEYEGAGHMLFQNAPQRTAPDVRAFLDRVMAQGEPADEAQPEAEAGA